MLQVRRALLKEEGDRVQEYKAMHEENFLSSWFRSAEEGRTKEEDVRSGKRKAEEEMERDIVGNTPACFNC